MEPKKTKNIQDGMLNHLRLKQVNCSIFLVNGIKLVGMIESFDNYVILVKSNNNVQMVYKHAISTVLPSKAIDAEDLKSIVS